MTFSFKLSKRLAQNFWVLGAAAALVACAGERSITDPTLPNHPSDSTPQQPQQPQQAAFTCVYYAAPGGSSTNDGSQDRPWDLVTALAGGAGRVQPGDTLCLRGGTYRGNFRSTLSGTANKFVVVRQYPGERAIIDGAGTPSKGPSVLAVNGQWSIFWGFEVMNSDAVRETQLLGNGIRPNSVANYASHTRYINMVVHDGGVAFYNDPNYLDVEVVGSIIYNNGWQAPDRGHGHAIYLRSNVGPVTARDNIIFNQFSYGVHVYTNPGEGLLNNIRIVGNVSFNNGTLSVNSTSANILVGGDDRATDDVVVSNMTYYSPTARGTGIKVGYGSTQNGTVEIRDNYAVRGGPLLNMGYWTAVTATGNSFIGTGTMLTLNDPSLPASTFAGQTIATLPTTTRVFVRKNPYETGRANIVVYNWGNDGAVAVDLAGIVPIGAQYDIRNVQDLWGTPVASGTFGGGSVTLPISGVQPPAPVGWANLAPTTGTEFNAYIVTIR